MSYKVIASYNTSLNSRSVRSYNISIVPMETPREEPREYEYKLGDTYNNICTYVCVKNKLSSALEWALDFVGSDCEIALKFVEGKPEYVFLRKAGEKTKLRAGETTMLLARRIHVGRWINTEAEKYV
jgi:hypothetical protein